ncbi:MAG: hypothetical protein DKINENOH_04363 [bacterium]|nr:hypothetical protein [bacterium]
MSRCHHGWPIKDSWMECPHCCAEHDARRAADALEDIARNRRTPEFHTYDYKSYVSPEQSTLERLRRDPSILDQFLKRRNGVWDHRDWLGLKDDLKRAGFVPFNDKDVGELLEQRKNVPEKQARESLSKVEKKLQAFLPSQVQKFAPNEVQAAQNDLNQAKQFFQNLSYVNSLKSIEFSERAIQQIQKIEQLLAERRRPFEEKLREKQNALDRNISSTRKNYNKQIRQQEDLERQNESKLSKYESNKPGCGLWIISWLGGVGLVVLLGSNKEFMRTHGDTNAFAYIIPAVLILYVVLRLLREIPKMSAKSDLANAKEQIKRISEKRDAEIDRVRKNFDNDFEVIELNQKIKNLQV